MISKLILVFALIILPLISNASIKDIGVPFIVNHSHNTYSAGTQNWSITQNNKGFLYFGNNSGILEYDGSNWNTFQMPNNSVVRSVLAVGDTVYAGAFDKIGFLAPDTSEQGNKTFNSLNHLVPPQYENFSEVWNIFEYQDDIIFQSFEYIFIKSGKKNDTLKVIEPLSSFCMMHFANDRFFIVDKETGLMELKNDSLQLVNDHPIFFRNEIRSILPYSEDSFIIGTSNEGLFIMEDQKLEPWDVDVNSHIKESSVYKAIKISDENYAFGSIRNGVYISDKEGNVLQNLNRNKGLQNNTVLSLFKDQRNNLWLGLDNGIDFIEINSPLSILNYTYNIEATYTSIIHNEIMYIGTNQGLYASEIEDVSNLNSLNTDFKLIKGTEGQVWTLDIIDNTLLCGHDFGAFQVNGFDARKITDKRGFWTFLKPVINENLIIAGTYNGLVRLINHNGTWLYRDEIEGFDDSSRKIFYDKENNLWVSHGYRGLYKLKPGENFEKIEHKKLYKYNHGLPETLPYNIQVYNGNMFVTTHSGIYQYDYELNKFIKEESLNNILPDEQFFAKLYQDNNKNIWYFTENSSGMGVRRFIEGGNYINITSPFYRINETLIPAFQNIYVPDDENVFIGTQNGLVHYDSSIIKEYKQQEDVYIKQASFYGNEDSISLYMPNYTLKENMKSKKIMPFSLNSVIFKFTLPVYENPDKTRFSFRLKGFEDNWSDWSEANFKEYTNLKEGDYVFELKALDADGNETQIKSFDFTIEPPFIRSPTAYAIYAFVLLIIIAANFYYIRKRILKTRKKEKIKHDKKLAKREKVFKEKMSINENEIMHLQHENIINKVKHKNKELANTTLHLINKNKTLSELKEDLDKLYNNTQAYSTERDIAENLIKKVNKNLNNENNWELFNKYFDEVHQDFIKHIKEKHPNLTPKELRLCAFLRMNISTKEIAPLMNISVRGVEISRYRLRKKMNLNRDENLTEYIINL